MYFKLNLSRAFDGTFFFFFFTSLIVCFIPCNQNPEDHIGVCTRVCSVMFSLSISCCRNSIHFLSKVLFNCLLQCCKWGPILAVIYQVERWPCALKSFLKVPSSSRALFSKESPTSGMCTDVACWALCLSVSCVLLSAMHDVCVAFCVQ